MGKQFWLGLIAGVVICGIGGGIIGISMVGRKATVKPLDLEAYVVNHLKNLKIPEASPAVEAVSTSDEDLIQGGEHYNHHCAICHDLEGDADSDIAKAFYPPVADLTSEHVQNYSDGQLKWIVENGIRFTGMPGWGNIIDETTQWRIVHYMRALADHDRAESLESILRERGKWKVEAPSENHHHDQPEVEESGHEHDEHVHEEPGGHVSENNPPQEKTDSPHDHATEHNDANDVEQSMHKVFLKSVGPQEIAVIKEVRAVTGLGLADAKNIVDGTPGLLIEGVTTEQAEQISTRFSDLGAVVEIQ